MIFPFAVRVTKLRGGDGGRSETNRSKQAMAYIENNRNFRLVVIQRNTRTTEREGGYSSMYCTYTKRCLAFEFV